MDGYLLFSHGSLLCGAGASLDEHVERLRARFGEKRVEVGYLNYSEPTVEEGIGRLLAAGATRIVVLPYFLIPGYFVTNSLPERLKSITADHPNIDFIVADALGTDERLADALIDAAQKATADSSRWRDVYDVAAASCRRRPDCPIHGTSDCPATAERL